MPAVSRAQRIAMAIAEHTPSKLYARNAALKELDKAQLHEFASTPSKGLPYRALKDAGQLTAADRREHAPHKTAHHRGR